MVSAETMNLVRSIAEQELAVANQNQQWERWIGKLGGVYQWRNVEYVNRYKDGGAQCLLCMTGRMTKDSRIHHFRGSLHSRKYNLVKILERKQEELKAAGKRMEEVSSIKNNRVPKLGLKKWRNQVSAGLLHYVTDNNIGTTLKDLERFERMERLSLLELAIWKVNIVDGIIFRDTYEVREQQALDDVFDAKGYMNTRRILCGCDIIIPEVAKFLWSSSSGVKCCTA